MPRTVAEMEKVEREFIKDVERRFLKRTRLGDMMTLKDKREHLKILKEYIAAIDAMKAEGK